jgi:hypothetical protein
VTLLAFTGLGEHLAGRVIALVHPLPVLGHPEESSRVLPLQRRPLVFRIGLRRVRISNGVRGALRVAA